MRQVFSTADDVGLLNFLKGKLIEQGIQAVARNELRAGSAAGEIPPMQLWPELLVHENQAEQALALIEQFKRDRIQLAVPWQCPNCGEALEPQFEVCWQCGTSRP